MIYCFFELSVGPAPIPGKVIFELFDAQVPKAAENFRALCTGELGGELTYKGTFFHRIVQTFTLQGGDTSKTGTGGLNIYNNAEDAFAGEDLYWRDLDGPFLLCAADSVPKSQFFITLRASPHLNGQHCCLGRVVKGQEILQQIGDLEVDEEDAPLEQVVIQRAGELAYKGPGMHVQPITALSVDAAQTATASREGHARGRSTTRSPSRARARSRSRRRQSTSSKSKSSESSASEVEEDVVEHSRPVSRDRRRSQIGGDEERSSRRHRHHDHHHAHRHRHQSHAHGHAHRSHASSQQVSRSPDRERDRDRDQASSHRSRQSSRDRSRKRRSRDYSADYESTRKVPRRFSRDLQQGSFHDRSTGHESKSSRRRDERIVGEGSGVVYKGRGKMRYDANEDSRYGRL